MTQSIEMSFGRRGHIQPNSRLTGPVTKRFRKTPNMHVEMPTTTSSAICFGEPGTNNKRLYTYTKGKKYDGSGVSPLKKDGVTYSDLAAQVEMLNSQFSNVFTKEDCSSMPQMVPSSIKTAPALIILEKGVKKLLDNQTPHKACGPDQVNNHLFVWKYAFLF